MAGLVRGVARTAAVAGTATVVSNRVSRRQTSRWAQQQGPSDEGTDPQQSTAASGGNDTMEQLKQLGELKSSGVLTNEEFEAQKAKILAQ
jgi:hypothetical protein